MSESKPKKTIIMFSTADWDNPFWTNKQHMAIRLGREGYRVIYIESIGLRRPGLNASDFRRVFSRLKRLTSMLRKVEKNVWIFTPFVIPFHSIPGVRTLNKWILRSSFTIIQKTLGTDETWVWTYHPLVIDYLNFLKPKSLIYHSVDDLSAAPRFPKEDILKAEYELLQIATHIFVTSISLREKYQQQTNTPIYYFPNVADYEHFSLATKASTEVPEDLVKIARPRIGFIGAVSGYKVDFHLIGKVARKRPEWQWILIGKIGEGDPDTDISLLDLPNIHLIGPRAYSELPSYLKGFDVVVIPCNKNEYTKSMFPMKFFEYLAAEKLIVTTEIPSLRDFRSLFIEARDELDFEISIEKVLNNEVKFTDEMRITAQTNTWENRLSKMLSVLGETK